MARLLVVVVAVGCGDSNQEPAVRDRDVTQANGPGDNSRPDVAKSTADESTFSVDSNSANATLAFEAADPGRGVAARDSGWDSELLGDGALGQLKTLCMVLTGSTFVTDADLQPIVLNDFIGSSLVPERTQVVFHDEWFRVERAEIAELLANKVRGRSALARALGHLVRPFHGAKRVQYEVKIHRIKLNAETFTARARIQLSGQTGDAMHQIRSEWRTTWKIPGRAESSGAGVSGRPLLEGISVVDYEHATGRTEPERLFADCTSAILGDQSSFAQQLAYGLDHWLGRIEKRHGMVASGWQGLAVADVNGDGFDDLYVCQPGGLPNRLYVQNPDGTAEDASAAAGVDWLIHTHGCLLVDLDNDHDQDLILATVLGLVIMTNDGTGAFAVKAQKLFPEAAPISLCAADFDDDGDLDLYACAYSRRLASASSQLLGRPVPYHDANNGGRNALFRNDRDWQFRDVTQRVGLGQNNQRFSLAAAWEDYDNDGDMDLYVANDYGRNNLYRNDDGQFHDVAAETGVEDISAGMSVSWGDVNNDGWMDLYVSNMWSSAGNRIAYQRDFLSAKASDTTLASFQRHARGNSLFLNGGRGDNGRFVDVSIPAGVSMGRWAWGSRLCDVNNDGLDDVLVANGFITQEDTGDL